MQLSYEENNIIMDTSLIMPLHEYQNVCMLQKKINISSLIF